MNNTLDLKYSKNKDTLILRYLVFALPLRKNIADSSIYKNKIVKIIDVIEFAIH